MILASMSSFCTDVAELWFVVGYAILILKFSFPVIIIALGMFDLGQAIVSNKDDTIKKAFKRIFQRILVGVIIFFIPSMIYWIFGLLNDYSNLENSFYVCKECLFHPTQDTCREAMED